MGGSKKTFKKLAKSASKAVSGVVNSASNVAKQPGKALMATNPLTPQIKAAVGVGEKVLPQVRDMVNEQTQGTLLGSLADMTVKGTTGGALSLSGGGFAEQGNPLAGNTLFNSFLSSGGGSMGTGGVLGEFVAEPIIEAKKAADVAAELALDASQDERARLAKEAKDREAQEKALKEASGSRSRRRMAQLRRQRTGLTGTRLGSAGSRALGAQQPGDSLLGT